MSCSGLGAGCDNSRARPRRRKSASPIDSSSGAMSSRASLSSRPGWSSAKRKPTRAPRSWPTSEKRTWPSCSITTMTSSALRALRIGLALLARRRGGPAIAAQIHGDDEELLGERGAIPAQATWVSPKPCSSSSGGPEPEERAKTEPAGASIQCEAKPGKRSARSDIGYPCPFGVGATMNNKVRGDAIRVVLVDSSGARDRRARACFRLLPRALIHNK